jgi:Rrf2 family nitric oxide-sensitive transcriptional repressor
MRLTVYADYSMRLLIYLAVQGDKTATIPNVAASYGISRNHLVKVAHRLGIEGYITTTRGKNGGLRLARPAIDINVGEVVRVMEPDMALVPCFHPINAPCPIVPSCLLRSAIEKAREAFIEALEEYTLADLTSPRASLQSLLKITQTTVAPSGKAFANKSRG